MGFLGRLFGSSGGGGDWSDEGYYNAKRALLTRHLGEPDESVLAAIIGWPVGGPVDLWLFPSDSGTVFTTMQLVGPGRTEQKRSSLGKYELAAATARRKGIDGDLDEAASPWLDRAMSVRSMLTAIGHYSSMGRLEPMQTAEIPGEEKNTCVVFDRAIGNETLAGEPFGLLWCIAVHPEELAFARSAGTEALIARLKQAGVYPTSDIDRDPVV
tara:strand:- start:12471 stop:13109 length:639 start_codon:yes stop_codon:yes gene_type:complete